MSAITNNGFKLKKGKGVTINFRGTKITVKVSGDDSDGRYTLIEMEHPPNTGPAFILIQGHLKPIMSLMVNTL